MFWVFNGCLIVCIVCSPEILFYMTQTTMIMKDQIDLEFESDKFHCPVCLKPFNDLDNLGVCGCSNEMILEAGQTKLEDLMKLQARLMEEIKGD